MKKPHQQNLGLRLSKTVKAAFVLITVFIACAVNAQPFFIPSTATSPGVDLEHHNNLMLNDPLLFPTNPFIGRFSVLQDNGSLWGAYINNGAGAGRVLRVKGGWYGPEYPWDAIFQVESNSPSGGHSEDNVRFTVKADGNVGIGNFSTTSHVVTDQPQFQLDIKTPQVTGYELPFRIRLDGPGDAYQVRNGTTDNNHFAPLVLGYSSPETNTPLTLMSGLSFMGDNGSEPVMRFDARQINDLGGWTNFASISNRPLFDWANNNSSKMRMVADGKLGIGTTSPGSKLEIKGAGNSGSTSSLNITNNSGVSKFKVFDDGKVGINTGAPTAQLHINSSGYSQLTSALQIYNSNGGDPIYELLDNGFARMGTSRTPAARLHIENNTFNPSSNVPGSISLYCESNGSQTGYAYGTSSHAYNGTGEVIGVEGGGNNSSTMTVGVQGLGYSGGNQVFGVRGVAQAGDNENYGVAGYANGGNTSYGVYGEDGVSGSASYAVYGKASNGGWAAYFAGPAGCTANMWTVSDQKLKKNIEPLKNVLDKISALQPKTYEFKNDEFPSMNLPKGHQMGLISQELEQVFPELVKETIHPATYDKNGKVLHEEVKYKAVNYDGLIPVLISGIKEQTQQIADLKQQLEEMKTIVANLSTQSHSTTPGIDFKNSGTLNGTGNEPVLYQNTPNPTSSSTIIRYFVPDNNGQAQMLVTDVAGRTEYLRMDLQKGNGQIEIKVGTIPAGTYIYSLILNGEKLDAKKMVISR